MEKYSRWSLCCWCSGKLTHSSQPACSMQFVLHPVSAIELNSSSRTETRVRPCDGKRATVNQRILLFVCFHLGRTRKRSWGRNERRHATLWKISNVEWTTNKCIPLKRRFDTIFFYRNNGLKEENRKSSDVKTRKYQMIGELNNCGDKYPLLGI